MKTKVHPVLPFSLLTTVDSPPHHLTPSWDFKLNVDAAVPRFGLNHLHLPHIPGRVFTGPWGVLGPLSVLEVTRMRLAAGLVLGEAAGTWSISPLIKMHGLHFQ